MKKIFVLFIAAFSSLGAMQISGKYDLSFSIFGKVGESVITYEREGDRYSITVDARTIGTAADLSGDRRELYISRGIVAEGVLRPEEYLVARITNDKQRLKRYRFDHEHQKVEVEVDQTKEVRSHRFDVSKMSIVETTKTVESHSVSEHEFYAENDLVSLFFNARTQLGTLQPGQSTELSAIGVNSDEGRITLNMPPLDEQRRMSTLMPAPGESDYFKIAVTEEIFNDDDGALLVRLDADSLPNQAMLEGVVMFGDIRAQRVYEGVAALSAR